MKRKRHNIYLFFHYFDLIDQQKSVQITICGQKSKDGAPLRNCPTQTAAPLFFILDVCCLLLPVSSTRYGLLYKVNLLK